MGVILIIPCFASALAAGFLALIGSLIATFFDKGIKVTIAFAIGGGILGFIITWVVFGIWLRANMPEGF